MATENNRQFLVKESALKHAAISLRRLADSGRRLEKSESVEDAQDAWEDFLQLTYKIYEKLRTGSKGNPKATQWYHEISKERKEDELLAYIHQARNADTHRLEEITAAETIKNSYRLTGDFFPANEVNFSSTGKVSGEWKGDPIVYDELINRLYALPVTNSGKAFPVPKMHSGAEIHDPNVKVLARLTYLYARNMVIAAHEQSR